MTEVKVHRISGARLPLEAKGGELYVSKADHDAAIAERDARIKQLQDAHARSGDTGFDDD